MKKICTVIATLMAIWLTSCDGSGRNANADSANTDPAPWDLLEKGEKPEAVAEQPPMTVYDSLYEDSAAQASAENTPDAVEMAPGVPDSIISADMSRFRGFGALAVVFNDSNKYQYAAGERIGIKPIRRLSDAYFLKRPMVRIRTCQWYNVDPLTHSIPYLVPEAASLLETIGRNFKDSLKVRKLPGHKFRVTSVLRTAQSVKQLRRVNRNATDSSTHQLGTTFDISYSRFDPEGAARVSDEQLKYILAEVLRDLRAQNKCMVKFEIKSPCFHITATGR